MPAREDFDKCRTHYDALRALGADDEMARAITSEVRPEKPKPRILRRFVNRGGQLVEVGTVIRETR